MRVAVCDDIFNERQKVVDYLREYREQWQFSCFECGEDLVEAIGDGQIFDLIFLDIYMKQLDGLETAKILRKMDCQTALIFLSSSRDFAVESYDVEALSYLVKPVEKEKLMAAIERFENTYRPKQIRCGTHLVGVEDILYIESQNKKVVANLKNGKQIEWTAKLSDVEEDALGKQFLRCHRSFLINMDVVSRVKGGVFILLNGTEIPIRRQDIAKISEEYYSYIIENSRTSF